MKAAGLFAYVETPMKFAQRFYGVPAGEIYPKWFEPGEDCPQELQELSLIHI